MESPWLQVPLADYEGHMEYVGQAPMLDSIFGEALRTLRPRSVAVLGAAGGNGFAHLVRGNVERVVAVDLNRDYLLELERRFGKRVRGLEIVCGDLADPALDFASVDLVHAALVFEYVEMDPLLARIRSWLQPGGSLSVVLQLPDPAVANVAPSPFTSLRKLGGAMSLLDEEAFCRAAAATGFTESCREVVSLPGEKRFYAGRYASLPIGQPGQKD